MTRVRAIAFCERHWESLCAGIKRVDLWSYVAQSGQEAAMHIKVDSFEPLMMAHNWVVELMLRTGVDFEGCPVCVSDQIDKEHRATNPECCRDLGPFHIIDHAVRYVSRQAEKRGLI